MDIKRKEEAKFKKPQNHFEILGRVNVVNEPTETKDAEKFEA